MNTFKEELEFLINKYSIEDQSNTPDFILAEYLINCLKTFNSAIIGRQLWVNSNEIELKDQEMVDFFEPLLNDLEVVIDKDQDPYSVFYKKNGNVIFEHYQNEELNYFYVDYGTIWSVFEDKFGLKYQEISDFIKGMVEKHLNLRGVTPEKVPHFKEIMVES